MAFLRDHRYVDELWDDIVFDGRKHVSLATLSPEVADLTVTSWGISKTWGLHGLQCGYLTATPKTMEGLKKHAKGVLCGTSTLFAPFLEDWRRCDGLAGRAVTVTSGAEQFCGVAAGISPVVALLVRRGTEVAAVLSGEVTVRQAA